MNQKTDQDNVTLDEAEGSLIDQILDEALQRIRSGQALQLDAYCHRYPELAEELKLMLPAMLLMEGPQSGTFASIPSAIQPGSFTPPILKDFTVVSEIGRGAMGIVYEAIQLPLKRRVALKVLFQHQKSDTYCRRFLREAEIAAQLHHTNIVPVFEAGKADGCLYFAMQLIEGLNLLQLIDGRQSYSEGKNGRLTSKNLMAIEETVFQLPGDETEREPDFVRPEQPMMPAVPDLSPRTCAKIVLQVAEALHYAHEHQILHRDIKPSNIMLDREQRAWIADFGLAKAGGDFSLTDANDVVGTIRYLAPERFQGKCDQRSDIYSLGVTLYELLEQRPFWPVGERAQLIHQIMNAPSGPSGSRSYCCPRDIQRVVEKATAPDPGDRYQNARDLAEDLRRFLDGRPILARKPSLIRRTSLWALRNKAVATLTGLLFLVASTSAIVTAYLSHRASDLSVESAKNFDDAKRNLGFLLETVDKVCMSLSQDQRLNRPEFQELRNQLLHEVIDFNHQFDGEPEIAEETRFLSARAHVRLGSLTSGGETLVESEGYLELARGILVEIHQASPYRIEFGLELAKCLRELAIVRWNMGSREDAMQQISLALETIQRLSDDEVNAVEADLELSRARLSLGGFLSDSGRKDEAEAYILDAIKTLEGLHLANSNNQNYATELGHANARLGQLYISNLQHWSRAGEPLNRAAQLYELVATLEPGNPDLAASQAKVLLLQSRSLYIGGQRQDAVLKLEQSCSILSELVTAHESAVAYRAQLASGLQRLAENYLYLDQKDPRIVHCLNDAAQAYNWLIEYDPENLTYKKGLCATYTDHAEVLSLQGHWQQSLDKLASTALLLDELQYLEATDPFLRNQRYFMLCKSAEMKANLGLFDESLSDWDTVIELASDSFRTINQIQRQRTRVLSGQIASGIAEVESIMNSLPADQNGRQHYLGNAACVYSIAYGMVSQDPIEVVQSERNEGYALRALGWLHELQRIGKLNPDFLESSRDYDSIRSRPEFQTILKAARDNAHAK